MELLANLRELQPVISKKVTEMSINYDLKKDFRYQQGMQLDIAEVQRIIAEVAADK
jgi:hypothetical protein